MSRNFELLQETGNVNLFLPTPEATAPATAVPIAEELVPTADDLQKQRSENNYVINELRPTNGHTITDAVSGSARSPRWFASVREGTKRLASCVGLFEHNGSGRGPLDLKAMTLQEEAKLVQRVFLAGDASVKKTIVFSAVENGEASARICARAAKTLAAHVQTSICVIDCDVSGPSLHQHLEARNHLGLTEAMVEKGPIRRFAQQLAQSNLWFIPFGEGSRLQMNPDALRARMQELRMQFGHLLISAPPMNAFSHAAMIGQLSDGVVLVIEANSTRRKTTKRLIEQLTAADVRVRGVVLNNRTFPIPEAVYRKL